jgi:predicted ATPase/DNA-binding CsgD family transcriptional regulator
MRRPPRFLTEARTLAHLSHPHIVRVLDFALHEGFPFLVMEYAPGGSLRQRHPAGSRLRLATIVSYISQVASALQYAHDQRLTHRDVKPENMLLGAREELLLADFGLVFLTAQSSAGSTQAMEPSLTGTIPYLAPEQLQGQPRPASDQYALGVVVYEWLCGSRPFSGPPMQIAMQQLSTPPASLREQVPDLPPAVEEVVLRALAKDPGQRFARVQDFASALLQAASAVVPLVSAADGSLPVRIAFGPSAAPAQEQTVPTPSAIAAPQVASEERETPVDTPPSATLWKVPIVLTPLVGREQDTAAVCALLVHPEVRLLTLLGAGGIGKTRLAIQVATQLRERFADGVCFVALAPIRDPNLLPSFIAHELGLQEGGAQLLVETVKAWLGDKQMLLLLDNFEQLVSAAPLLEDLLKACPRLAIVVTSREVLHIHAEHLFPVPPLALPELAQLPEREELAEYASVALFLQRAQTIKLDFQLTPANGRAIAEICVRLDGLPLALELAAARVRVLPPQALLSRLSQRFQVLTGGPRTMPERQQTLRNTLQWSYDLLDAQEQRLFRRLSVFVGGCNLQAVDALYSTLGDGAGFLLDGVASLIDKSLLQQTEQEGEEPRLVMLETIHEYGRETLAASGEGEAALQAHALYYLSVAEQAQPQLGGPEQIRWLERLERDHDNLRAALGWSLEQAGQEKTGEDGRREIALRLGRAMRWFWVRQGYLSEGRNFLERALARSGGASPLVQANALIAAARIALNQGDYDQGEAWAEEGLAVCREHGDKSGAAYSLYLLAWVAWERGHAEAARAWHEESLALYREVGDRENVAYELDELARLLGKQGDYDRAYTLVKESLAIHRELGNKWGLASSLYTLADIRLASQGDLALVSSLLEESAALYQEMGEREGIADSLYLRGQVALRQGEAARARKLAEESLTIYRELGHRRSVAETLILLAKVVAAQADYPAARALYEESLVLCNEMGSQVVMASCLEGLAAVILAQGQAVQAVRLLGTAETLRESADAPIPLIERAEYESLVNMAQARLTKPIFSAAWSEGRTMPLEQALSAQKAATMPVSISPQPPSPSPAKTSSGSPAGLTTREMEVLRLVAKGLTDAQVAEQLVISPRTVNFHLTSIYSKLGVSSRSAATRYAIEQQLV